MSQPLVLLYSSPEDPVATCGLVRSSKDSDVKAIHIDELLPFFSARPWPEILRVEAIPELRQVFAGARIVNRIFNLSHTQTLQYLNEHSIDERWLHIRLRKILGIGGSLSYDTGVRGVSRSLLPLNAQWFEIRRILPNLAIPEFTYAFGYEQADLTALNDPIQKSVWSLFDWKEERHLSIDEARRHQFFVERPKGVPLISYFLGKDFSAVHFPREAMTIDAARIDEINHAARSAFKSECGELLLYAEGQELRFYAFSPYLSSIAATPSFERDLEEWLHSNHESSPTESDITDVANRLQH